MQSSTTVAPPFVVDRIGVRTVDGVGEFYNTATGERFVSRGVNYLDFQRRADVGVLDSVFAVSGYDAGRVRVAFRSLASLGYNTVRIFYDICDRGPQCLVGPDRGWSDPYVDNIADTMAIAAQENIHILFTANSIPVRSVWQDTYHDIFGGGESNGLIHNLNGYWLHEGGIAARAHMFEDLMEALSARDVPFEAVLGWQMQNELWLDPNLEPLSLREGIVDAVAGQYDVADPDQRRALVADSVIEFVARMRAVLQRYDPDGLVTVGFFSPAVANEWAYVDTASLIDVADVDFWDFHAYHDTYETLQEQAEAFGMIGYEEKPILLGETGGGKAIIPSPLANLGAAHDWMAESCELGFDGWLNWGYYAWPPGLGGAAWSFLDGDGLLMEWAAPSNHPDLCVVPEAAPRDLTRIASISASRSFEGDPPTAVADGSSRSWNAGDFPPQWVQFDFADPVDIAEIGLAVEQWPPGPTRHQIWVTHGDGERVLLAELEGFTEPETVLAVPLDGVLRDVLTVRIETLEGPAWVAWREVSIVPATAR